jgi:hypothetical protein
MYIRSSAVCLVGSSLLMSFLSGCIVTLPAHMYPVQGPASQQPTLAVISATLTGSGNSGSMTATLPDGEICKGAVAQVPLTDPSPPVGLAGIWDSVYGHGFYVAQVLGTKFRARGLLVGNAGTSLDFELVNRHPGTQAGNANTALVGVARDNHGNVYKVTF